MKKTFTFLFAFCASSISLAAVPLEQCFDLYLNTKKEHKDISPAWAKIMLQSGHLRGVRFFGDFTSDKNSEFKPHPAFNTERDTLKHNAPQDPISALMQYLFPSTNGQILAFNQRQNDPLGQLGKKEKLSKVSDLILAIFAYKKDRDSTALKVTAEKILDSVRSQNDKSKKTRPVFDHIKNNFVSIFVKAVILEENDVCKTKYPPHIIVHAFFAFALSAADNIEDIYHHFRWIFNDKIVLNPLTKENYDALVSEIIKDKKLEKIDDDLLIRALMGKACFDDILPAPLTYVKTFYEHNGIPIYYPNCGETSLLNFFYYAWNDHGIINPDIINTTEKKFSGKSQDTKKQENWKKLKDYFLKYPTISASLSHQAQKEWSHIVSNLNTDNTDPSLKIVYRQKFCNIQGIGLLNMLNVIEKLIPDELLALPFNKSSEIDNFTLATNKLNKLVHLFSRDDTNLDWHVNGKQKIKSQFLDIIFNINNKDLFKWSFGENSFSLRPVKSDARDQIDWRNDCAWEKTPLLLKSWVRSDVSDLNNCIEHPSEIYALNLLDTNIAAKAIHQIITKKWIHLKSLIPQIVGKTLFVEDLHTQEIIYTLLHLTNGIIDDHYYPEFDWKTYIPEFSPLETTKLLEIAAKLELWDILPHYSLEENFNAKTHFIATEKGYLPIVQWVLNKKPEALYDEDALGLNLVQIVANNGHFKVLDYLLGFLKSHEEYDRRSNGLLLGDLFRTSHDMTHYLNMFYGTDPSAPWNDVLTEKCSEFTHIKNIKFIIDKMVEFRIDLMNYYFIPCMSLESMTYSFEKGLLSKESQFYNNNVLQLAADYGRLDLAQFLIQEKGFDVNAIDANGNNLQHNAASGGSLPLIHFLKEKGV